MDRIKGSKDLIFDAVEETTNLVQRMHELAARKSVVPFMVIEPLALLSSTIKSAHDLTASGVYETIRIFNRGIKKLLDIGSGFMFNGGKDCPGQEFVHQPTPMCSDAHGSPSWAFDHAEAALNGLYGDYLHKKLNALDIGMNFRYEGRILALEPDAITEAYHDLSGKICVFVHGLSCTEWSWCVSAEEYYGNPKTNFGVMLKQELGYTPLYVRYNTGRHISENGRLLSALLNQLIKAYPRDIEEIIIIGHSMGGLVIRSAAYYGNQQNEDWIKYLSSIFCLGSPHLGAPLEKATNVLSNLLRVFNTPGTQVPAEFLNSRSAGIKDLRFGYTIDEEWNGKDPDTLLKNERQDLSLIDGVGYYFIASVFTQDQNNPLGAMLGDLMVRLPSAAGQSPKPASRIAFRSGHCITGLDHFHLTNHPDVYQAIRQCMELPKT